MVFSVPANASVKDYLDIGSRSLLYFEYFEPRYRRAFGGDLPAGFPAYSQLHKRFYEQNGLNEDKLLNTSAKLQTVLQEAGAQLDVQRGYAKTLPLLWTGQAATAALDMLNKQINQADTNQKAAREASTAIAGSFDGLRAAAKVKAEAVRFILENGEGVRIADKTPEDVDDIISGRSIGASNGWDNDSLLNKLRRIFPDLQGGADAWVAENIAGILGDTDYRRHIQERCSHWLDNVFKPDYLNKVKILTDACDAADRGFKQVYDHIIQNLDKVSDARYDRPAGVAAPDNTATGPTNTAPTNTAPTNTSPTNTSPTNTTTAAPTTTTPTTTSPATTTTTSSNPLQGLASLTQSASQLSSLAQTVSQGLTSLGTSIKSGVDSAVEQLTKSLETMTTEDEDGDKDQEGNEKDKSVAEFDLGGKHMKIEIGADGQPKFVVVDGDGKTHEYGVKLDEKGNPTISIDEPKVDDGKSATPGDKPTTETPESSEEGTPDTEQTTGGPGSVPGVPSPGKREEDGEHTPQPMPEGNSQTEEPVDSGAKLAEAGPL